ncbi:50S ribosomal protein L35 [Kiritimatiellaeota bacterium B1221]|nr:50S ribosomal protein L35 [Kiritimatiellaeota bacterium B1221]
MAKSAKTRKSVAKKFKRTGTGKLVFRSPGGRHLLTSKTRKRKRNLNQDKVMFDGDAKRYTSI